MPAGALVDTRREPLVFGNFLRRDQHESAVAIAAFGDARLAQLQPHARMAERAADAVARDAVRGDPDHFRLGLGGRHVRVAFRASRD